MKALKAYTINFASLSDGQHEFDYTLGKKFLEHFEKSLIDEADVTAAVTLLKREDFLSFQIQLGGTIPSICDVCNEEFDFPIDGADHIVVKFVSELPEEDAEEPDILYLEHGETQLKLANVLYETLMLSIPIRKVHPDDDQGEPTCNPVVLEYLEENDGLQDTEEEAEEEKEENSVWAELKKLKDLK